MLNQRARLDLVFHALSASARRSIVERLARGPAATTELAKPLDMSLPAVVQHLHVLEESGLVVTEKIGRTRRCRLRPAALSEMERWAAARRSQLERSLDRLANALGE
jgi:DNA-binding transcriptional ArsR family regulator